MLLLYPAHLIVAFFGITCGLAAGLTWLLVALIAAEVALALALAPLAPFARLIERRTAQLERRRLVARMDGDHRAELLHLEKAVDEVRGLRGVSAALVDLDGLIATYVQLAGSCSESRQLMARFVGTPAADMTRPPALLRRGPSVGTLRERRCELTALRLDSYRQARHDTEELELQLGIISDVVLLVHQQAIAATCRLHAHARAGELVELACTLRDSGDPSMDAQAELEALAAD